MAYIRRTPSAAAAARTTKAPLREVSSEGSADDRLDRLTVEILKRMEAEVDRYTVAQLLSGLHKCLQVRVLLLTLRQKGGGSNVGESVRRYAGAFQTSQDGNSRRTRGSRRAFTSDPDDTVVELLANADSDDE